MWKVFKDGVELKEFEKKEDAHKFKDDCIDRDIKKKDLGHRYKVEFMED